MKKLNLLIVALVALVAFVILTSCDLFGGSSGGGSKNENFTINALEEFDESGIYEYFDSVSGKLYILELGNRYDGLYEIERFKKYDHKTLQEETGYIQHCYNLKGVKGKNYEKGTFWVTEGTNKTEYAFFNFKEFNYTEDYIKTCCCTVINYTGDSSEKPTIPDYSNYCSTYEGYTQLDKIKVSGKRLQSFKLTSYSNPNENKKQSLLAGFDKTWNRTNSPDDDFSFIISGYSNQMYEYPY